MQGHHAGAHDPDRGVEDCYEAKIHPISQLIPSLKVPVVVTQESNAIFAIDSSVHMSLALGKWEVRCSILLLYDNHRCRREDEPKFRCVSSVK